MMATDVNNLKYALEQVLGKDSTLSHNFLAEWWWLHAC